MLLKYGQTFEPAPLPHDIAVMEERCCYLNAFTLDRFTYFEGYGVLARTEGGWGYRHAWCVEREGHVVDPTWENIRTDRPGGYVGIPVPLNVVQPYAYRQSAGTINGWRRDRPGEMETVLPRLLGVEPI